LTVAQVEEIAKPLLELVHAGEEAGIEMDARRIEGIRVGKYEAAGVLVRRRSHLVVADGTRPEFEAGFGDRADRVGSTERKRMMHRPGTFADIAHVRRFEHLDQLLFRHVQFCGDMRNV